MFVLFVCLFCFVLFFFLYVICAQCTKRGLRTLHPGSEVYDYYMTSRLFKHVPRDKRWSRRHCPQMKRKSPRTFAASA